LGALNPLERLARLNLYFWIGAIILFVLLMWLTASQQKKNCDDDMEILTVDCLLKQHREELRQLELEKLEKLNGR